jgi:hypothetical protein
MISATGTKLINHTRKSPTGCWAFLLSNLLKLESVVHQEYELKLLQDQSDSDGLVPN